jgi:hypothetical protein
VRACTTFLVAGSLVVTVFGSIALVQELQGGTPPLGRGRRRAGVYFYSSRAHRS